MFGEIGPKMRSLTATVAQWLLGTANTWTKVQTFSAGISSPGTGSTSESFGAGASVSGNSAVAVGVSATVGANSGLAVGYSASVPNTSAGGTAVGYNAAVGNSAPGAMALGGASSVSGNATGAIALGSFATAMTANIFIVGSSTYPINKYTNIADIGGLTFAPQALSSTATPRTLGSITFAFAVSTDATYTGSITIAAGDHAGTREGIKITSNGSVALIGFYGATPVAKPAVTGDKTADLKAVVTSFLSALSTLGLITDSTT